MCPIPFAIPLAREDVRSLAARIVAIAILAMGTGVLVSGVVVLFRVSFLAGILLGAFGLLLIFGGLMFSLMPMRLAELRQAGLAARDFERERERRGN